MVEFSISEVQQLLATDELDSWRDPSTREAIQRARTKAFLLRQKKKRSIQNLHDGRKKRSAIANNRKVEKDARKHIVNAKRRIAGKRNFDDVPRGALVAKMKQSILLGGLVPDRARRWRPISKRLRTRESTSVEAEDFCFLPNPVGTLRVLAEIASAETRYLSASIDFVDKHCKDIGPWLVLSAMRADMAPMFSGGRISNSMSKVISAVGLQGRLRFELEPTPDGHADVWAFPLRARRPAGTSTSESQHLDPQAAEKVGGDLCQAISAWLGECVGQSLTTEGRRCDKKIVGESLDNAERHSRREYENDGDWMITGFMARREGPNGPLFRCQLAFLSVGASISETVQDAPKSTLDEMEQYVSMHQGANPNHSYAEQHLQTIFALQDTVTRDHKAAGEGRGGTGFRDIICLFGDLAGSDATESDARISVVSGRTCLHIDHKHSDKARPMPGQRFNIWLNEANDELQPPETHAVKELENDFCGTLISMGFTLDPDYLERTVNA